MSKEKEHLLEEPETEFSKKAFPITLPEGYDSILETLTLKIRAAQARAMLAGQPYADQCIRRHREDYP